MQTGESLASIPHPVTLGRHLGIKDTDVRKTAPLKRAGHFAITESRIVSRFRVMDYTWRHMHALSFDTPQLS